jgi:DNA-binding transcriptional ArsR family regulator
MTSELPSPAIEDVDLGTVLSALADPLRRGIITELARGNGLGIRGERACGSFALPVAKSTRTYHWRILREAGLIRQRNAGNGTFVRLRRDEFDARFPCLLDLIVDLTPSRSAGDGGAPAPSPRPPG